VDITTAIDKLDKIGLEKVREELLAKGISAEGINKLKPVLTTFAAKACEIFVCETSITPP